MIQSLAVGVLNNFQLHHLWLNFQISRTFERLLTQIISLSYLVNNLLWDFYILVIHFGLTVVESVHKHVCICSLSNTFSFISSKHLSYINKIDPWNSIIIEVGPVVLIFYIFDIRIVVTPHSTALMKKAGEKFVDKGSLLYIFLNQRFVLTIDILNQLISRYMIVEHLRLLVRNYFLGVWFQSCTS